MPAATHRVPRTRVSAYGGVLVFNEKGSQEVKIKWGKETSFVKFDVEAGPPAVLEVVDWDVRQVRDRGEININK